MEDNCDACQFLQNPNPKTQILVTEHWCVGLGNNHAYFGRAYCTLRTHKGSLSSLDEAEWQDYQEIVRKLEKAYKEVFGAEPMNWGCFMNNAYRVEPAKPHVHWHIFPRYKTAPVLDGITFDDPLYGEFYDDKAERLVSDGVVEHIADKLRAHLAGAA